MTAVTGTGCTRFLRHVTDYFSDYYVHSTSFDFQGATAYLDWDCVFTELFFTLLHTNCTNFNIVTFYVNLGLRHSNLELRALSPCH